MKYISLREKSHFIARSELLSEMQKFLSLRSDSANHHQSPTSKTDELFVANYMLIITLSYQFVMTGKVIANPVGKKPHAND